MNKEDFTISKNEVKNCSLSFVSSCLMDLSINKNKINLSYLNSYLQSNTVKLKVVLSSGKELVIENIGNVILNYDEELKHLYFKE